MDESLRKLALALLALGALGAACGGDPVGSWEGTYVHAVYARLELEWPMRADFCPSGDVHFQLLPSERSAGVPNGPRRSWWWRWFEGEDGIETESDDEALYGPRFGRPRYVGHWDVHVGTLEFGISDVASIRRFPELYTGSAERVDSDPDDCPTGEAPKR